jgi:hypothetical protein
LSSGLPAIDPFAAFSDEELAILHDAVAEVVDNDYRSSQDNTKYTDEAAWDAIFARLERACAERGI